MGVSKQTYESLYENVRYDIECTAVSTQRYSVSRVLLYCVEQWFPKWAIPPPGGRWDYRSGR